MTVRDRLLLDAGAVSRLNWQPRVCPPPLPCIASRVGDTLELVFVDGLPRIGNNGNAGHDPASWDLSKVTRHRYRLEPISDDVVVATLITNTEGNEHNG